MRALVVEDDPVARRLIERTVEEFDHAVAVAIDGAEARLLVAERRIAELERETGT